MATNIIYMMSQLFELHVLFLLGVFELEFQMLELMCFAVVFVLQRGDGF